MGGLGDKVGQDSKLAIRIGEFEFEYDGSTYEIDEKFAEFKQEGLWGVITERLQEAKEQSIDSSVSVSQEKSISQRGMKFRTLLENCTLDGKPEKVLGAIHFLRDLEGNKDCPPRTVNRLFEEANIEPPGNLSLYINRLREKGFLDIPKKYGDKNRHAELTALGRKHLEEKSSN